MATPTDADTRSPWYECFESTVENYPAAVPTLSPAVAELLADLLADAGGTEDESDGASDALFDYYNA